MSHLPESSRPVAIPTRSERQAMDWSLVLASQSIEVEIATLPDRGRCALLIGASDADRARRILRDYLRENQGWNLRMTLPGAPAVSLHWLGLMWVFLIALVHAGGGPSIRRALFQSDAALSGQWWRPFTATWIHADIAHLGMNAFVGGPLLSLAMGRYGPGPALAGTLGAGALANVTAAALRSEPYVGLGASGAVMAAIGMLSANLVGHWRHGWQATRWVAPTFMAAAVLFLHLGTGPQGDVLVHALGFAFGVPAGIVAALWPERHLRFLDTGGWTLAGIMAIAPWAACILP